MGLLEQERDSLLDKLVDYNKMLHGERIEREQLQKQLKVCATFFSEMFKSFCQG